MKDPFWLATITITIIIKVILFVWGNMQHLSIFIDFSQILMNNSQSLDSL
jgi:hypothetical protein